MLQLNLISDNLKKEIKLRHIYQLFKKMGYILIIFFIFIAIIILTARVILQNNFNRVVAETTYITRNSGKFILETKEINEKIDYISQVQSDFISWSSLLKLIGKNHGSDVGLFSIKINKDKKFIDLKGIARDRNGLIDFKDWLEESNFFTNINFPIKNILEKENIEFDITADLNMVNIKENIK